MKYSKMYVYSARVFYLEKMIMQHEAILYSLDPKIKLSQLQEFTDYDTNKYSKLKEWIEKNDIWAMMSSDWDFHFKFLPVRPRIHIFYYMGDISLLNKKMLGIVWPRKMSSYGKQVIDALFLSSQAYNITTISGMAEGVDQYCHQLSREYTLPTIAVLGWGLGRYLKRQEGRLIEQIVASGGLVISEYKLWEKPTQYTFPQRNRLIAWLADILFLPEAWEKSGSLITVDCAIAMKKPVYATPNSIFTSTSAGILPYIEKGDVQMVYTIPKFLSTHFTSKNIQSRTKPAIILTKQEQSLVSVFSRDRGSSIQELVNTTGFSVEELIQLLTMLEIKGVIQQASPGEYVVK